MVSWNDFAAAVPDLSAGIRARFDAHVHKTMATLRADGWPRISGTEARFATGELVFGSMPGSRKSGDLRRDPRMSLHSGSDEPQGWEGDGKLAGYAAEIVEPGLWALAAAAWPDPVPEGSVMFRLDITEAVLISLSAAKDKLIVSSWTVHRGLEVVER